jgi:hypothetical protein
MFTGKWTGGAVAGVSFSLIFSIKTFHGMLKSTLSMLSLSEGSQPAMLAY